MGRWFFSGIRKDLSEGGCPRSRNMVVLKVGMWLFSKWEGGCSQSGKVVVLKVGRWLFSGIRKDLSEGGFS